MNASIAAVAASLAGWLADFYLLATLLLLLAFVGWRSIRQPVHRLTVAWAVMVELALLAVVCASPGWPRLSLIVAAPGQTASDLSLPAASRLSEVPPRPQAVAADMRYGGPLMKTQETGGQREATAPASPEPPVSFKPRFAWTLPSLRVLIAGAFLTGLALVGLWLALGAAGAWRLCRQSVAAPASLRRELAGIVRGSAFLPRVLLSPRIGNAVALGVLRPTILLPATLAQEGPPQALRAVLSHEWAHIRNRDLWLLAVGRCLLALLFAHPLFWWLRRRIRDDQEAVADAVAARDNRHDYAKRLLDWVKMTVRVPRLSLSPAVGIWEGSSQLSRRIAMLLDETFRVAPAASRRWQYRAVALLVVLGLGLSVVSLRAAPPIEKASPPAAAGESKPGEGLTYTGKVTDKVTGKPIAGATVTVRRAISSDSGHRTIQETKHETDAEGKYTFTVPPEQVAERFLYIEMDVTHPQFAAKKGFGYALSMIRKNEKLGERPFFENIALIPGEEVSGTIVTPEGTPVAGVLVVGFSMLDRNDFESASFNETKTDDKGFFRLMVAKGGDAVFWPLPENYAPCIRYPEKKRGDQGRIVLEKGVVLQGRAVDEKGSPVAGVWVNAWLRGGPAMVNVPLPVVSGLRRTGLTNQQGEFRMNPLPVGEYLVRVEDYPGDHLNRDRTRRIPPAVFVEQKVELRQGETSQSVEVRAVPHVVIEGQYYTSDGKPRTGHEGHVTGKFGDGYFIGYAWTDDSGKIVAKAPKGLKEARLDLVTNEHSALRWRKSKDAPLSNSRQAELGTVEADIRGIEIIRYEAPIVLVKAVAEDGSPVKNFKVTADYPLPKDKTTGFRFIVDGLHSDVTFEKQEDGRRRSEQLLPDEEFTLTVHADGFKPKSEKLKLPEGAVKELEVKLERQ